MMFSYDRASIVNARSPSMAEVSAQLKERCQKDETMQKYLVRLTQKLKAAL